MVNVTDIREHWARWTDTPMLDRDLATLWSGWRVGVWFLAINLVLGVVVAATLGTAAEGDESLAVAAAQVGFGQFMACMVLTALGGVITVLVPIRAAGCYWWPRKDRYFDQVVLSGISPTRYLFGKILAQNAFLGLLVAVALPYFILSLSLGGVRPLYLVQGLLALWLYGNLLTVLMLSAGAHSNEAGNALGLILVFSAFYLFGLAPVPPFANVFTPSHLLLAPLFESLTDLDGMEPNRIVFEIAQYKLAVGGGLIYFGSVLVWLAAAVLGLILGPIHCLVRENNTFGEVVMEGDNRRHKMFRQRTNMRRASEIAFFYENREPWVRRWEVPLRWGTLMIVLVILLGVGTAITAAMTPGLSWDRAHTAVVLLVLGSGAVGAIAFTSYRATEMTSVAWGDRRFRVGEIDTRAWLAFVVAALVLVPTAITLRVDSGGRSQMVLALLRSLPMLALYLGWFYALVRYLCLDRWSAFSGYFGAACLAAMMALAPLGLGGLLAETPPVLGAVQKQVGGFLVWLSPIAYLAPKIESNRLLPTGLRPVAQTLGFLLHLSLLLFMLWLLRWGYRRLERHYRRLPCDAS